jgi:thioredoxin 1
MNGMLLRYIGSVLLCLVMLMPTVSNAQHRGGDDGPRIDFIDNAWGEALKQADRQNKYIFVDAYAVWCGPCKMLRRTTFKDKDVADFFNENFVNVAMDMEKGQGPDLARQWALEGYPTLLIFDSKGKRLTQSTGYIQPDELLKFGKRALGKQ